MAIPNCDSKLTPVSPTGLSGPGGPPPPHDPGANFFSARIACQYSFTPANQLLDPLIQRLVQLVQSLFFCG